MRSMPVWIRTCATSTASGAQVILLLPFRLAGLTSEDGYPSFSKYTVAIILASYLILRPVPLGVAIACISGAFGLKAWLAFLDSKTVTAHEEMETSVDITAIAKEVLERRKSGDHEETA